MIAARGSVFKLQGKPFTVGKIRAVYGTGETVFRVSADQVMDTVTVQIRHERGAESPELQTVIASYIGLVRFHEAFEGEAMPLIRRKTRDIAL